MHCWWEGRLINQTLEFFGIIIKDLEAPLFLIASDSQIRLEVYIRDHPSKNDNRFCQQQ